ncbi:equilibrative nucleobase transporter 1-like isoform X2 [Oratosquilla oratoria]|uniref:equilibrative nucleobase transporter 1-like isoform X2 n=1 Tax=Oratosquilla oratoria TaxID=337810 RepID=UPI003F76E3C7
MNSNESLMNRMVCNNYDVVAIRLAPRYSCAKKLFFVIIGFIETLLLSANIFGWAGLLQVLKINGIYSDRCQGFSSDSNAANSSTSSRPPSSSSSASSSEVFPKTNETLLDEVLREVASESIGIVSAEDSKLTTCAAQEDVLGLVYSLATFIYGGTSILVGFLLDPLGIWKVKIVASFCLATSYAFLALTTPESPGLLFPSMLLLAWGGNQLRIVNLELANFFPKWKSTIICLYGGAFCASASVFSAFRIAQENGIPSASCCYAVAGVALLITPLTLLLPKDHVPVEEEREVEGSSPPGTGVPAGLLESTELMKEKEKGLAPATGKMSVATPPLRVSLGSTSFILHQIWFATTCLVILMYLGALNPWLYDVLASVREVNAMTSWFGVSQLAGPLLAPLAGIVMDYLADRATRNSRDDPERRVTAVWKASVGPLAMTSLLSAALTVSRLFSSRSAILVSMVFLTLLRPSVISCAIAHLRLRFPANHFNRLNGIFSTITSVLTLVQYPLFLLSNNVPDMEFMIQCLLLMLVIGTFLNPLHYCFDGFLARMHKKETSKYEVNTFLV